MNFGNKIGAQRSGFPLTAMIDIMFLLLIFFMAASMYAQFESELTVDIPTSTEATQIERDQFEVIINVTADGKFVINQIERPVNRDEAAEGEESIEETLEKVFYASIQSNIEPHIIIRGDKVADYNDIIKVLDVCKRTNIWNISFAVIKHEEVPK